MAAEGGHEIDKSASNGQSVFKHVEMLVTVPNISVLLTGDNFS